MLSPCHGDTKSLISYHLKAIPLTQPQQPYQSATFLVSKAEFLRVLDWQWRRLIFADWRMMTPCCSKKWTEKLLIKVTLQGFHELWPEQGWMSSWKWLEWKLKHYFKVIKVGGGRMNFEGLSWTWKTKRATVTLWRCSFFHFVLTETRCSTTLEKEVKLHPRTPRIDPRHPILQLFLPRPRSVAIGQQRHRQQNRYTISR